MTHLGGSLHHFPRERSVDDKVSIIADDRSGLCLAHSQGQDGAMCASYCRFRAVGGRAELGEFPKDGDVGEGSDLDGDTLVPLKRGERMFVKNRGSLTLSPKVSLFFR